MATKIAGKSTTPVQLEAPVLRAGKATAKVILWVAGFGAAVATIIGWVQLAANASNPYQGEYTRISRLAVGVSTEYFSSVLGVPAISDDVYWGSEALPRDI